MFRSRAPRVVVAALTAVVLIVGLMASATSAAPKPKPTPTPTPTPTPSPTPLPTPIPTPTPASTNRIVYFGWPDAGHDRQLDPSTATTGGVYIVDVIARNDDNQALTHPRLAFGDAAEPGGPTPNGLPSGSTIIDVDTTGVACLSEVQTATSYSCDLPNFAAGDSITARFTIQAGNNAVINELLWMSFKVAEKVSNQGANQNTAFASSPILIQPTDSNRNATFKLSGQDLTLKTGDAPAGGDKQVTILNVPGGQGGVISIFETDNPQGCSPACIGQEVLGNVRDGVELDPYLVWEFRIAGLGAGNNKGGVYHENAAGEFDHFVFSNQTICKTATQVDCFELYEVNKNANSTKIIFRSATNGKIRAN